MKEKSFSIPLLILLHFLPGIIFVFCHSLVMALLPPGPLPVMFRLCLSILLFLIPALLLIIGHFHPGLLSRDMGKILFGSQSRLSASLWGMAGLVLILAVGLPVSLLPIDSWIRENLFFWVPPVWGEWFDFTDFLLDGESFTREIRIAAWGINFAVVGILAPLAEEIYFREFLLKRMNRNWGLLAPLLSSLLFGMYHLWSPEAFLTRALFFFPVAVLVWKKECVWISIVAHCAVNIIMGNLATIPLVFG